jgi:hypothetical protein
MILENSRHGYVIFCGNAEISLGGLYGAPVYGVPQQAYEQNLTCTLRRNSGKEVRLGKEEAAARTYNSGKV